MDGAYESFKWAKKDELLDKIQTYINFELVKTKELDFYKSLNILEKKS